MKIRGLMIAFQDCGPGAHTWLGRYCENRQLRGEGTPPTKGIGSPRRAFSLIELLVVIGLIGLLAAAYVGDSDDGGRAPALSSAQAMLCNLLMTARTTAMAHGRSSRVLVQMDATNQSQPARFLHQLVLQIQTTDGWQTLAELSLPEGVYVVPGNLSAIPTGLFAETTPLPWIRSDGSDLRSTALRQNQLVPAAIHGGVMEQWASIIMVPSGGTIQSGDIILALGKLRSPASYQHGESPVVLTNAAMVRGLALSSYGVPALINDRSGF